MNSVSYHAHPCSMICHRIPPWIIFIKLKVLVRWKTQIHDVQKKKPMTDYWSSHLNLIYTSHTHIHIYIYIYLLLGEAWGSPEHRGTFNLAIQLYMSDLLLIYRRVGRCGINVLWTGLEPRCCYVEDVEHVATLKTLLCWRCCYVEDVFTLKMLKMLLCWNVIVCAFRPCFSGELWHFYGIHENTEILSTRNSTGFYGNNIKWRTWNTWN